MSRELIASIRFDEIVHVLPFWIRPSDNLDPIALPPSEWGVNIYLGNSTEVILLGALKSDAERLRDALTEAINKLSQREQSTIPVGEKPISEPRVCRTQDEAATASKERIYALIDGEAINNA